MDVNPISVAMPPSKDASATSPSRHCAGRRLEDAKVVAAVLLLLSAAADPPAPGTPQLRRLIELLNPCVDPVDEKAAVLRQVYGAVNDLRRLGG